MNKYRTELEHLVNIKEKIDTSISKKIHQLHEKIGEIQDILDLTDEEVITLGNGMMIEGQQGDVRKVIVQSEGPPFPIGN